MKFKQLGKRYPKAFDVFIDKMNLDYDYIMDADVRCYWKEITDFMDKQGILILINHITFGIEWRYDIEILANRSVSFQRDIKSRKLAEIKAIEKAFEILEQRLK